MVRSTLCLSPVAVTGGAKDWRSWKKHTRGDAMSTTDHKGRPVVAVTGIGIITSLGTGKADNWAKLSRVNPVFARSLV